MNSVCNQCHGDKIIIIADPIYCKAERCSACFQKCHQCNGEGYILYEDEFDRPLSKRCDCHFILRKIQLINNAQLPQSYYNATLYNFENLKQLKKLRSILASLNEDFKQKDSSQIRGYLFHGSAGTGKTRLVVSILKLFILRYAIPCLFVEFSKLISDIKYGYNRDIPEVEIIAPLVSIPVLAIDELGKGRNNEWEIAILDSIISKRYNAKKQTYFTTNYPDTKYIAKLSETSQNNLNQSLRERVDDRIYSRLKEMCVFCTMDQTDFRIPASEIYEANQLAQKQVTF